MNFLVYRRPVYVRHRRIDPTLSRFGAWKKALRFNFQYDAEAERRSRIFGGHLDNESGPAVVDTRGGIVTQHGASTQQQQRGEEEKREEETTSDQQLQLERDQSGIYTSPPRTTPHGVTKRVPLKM